MTVNSYNIIVFVAKRWSVDKIPDPRGVRGVVRKTFSLILYDIEDSGQSRGARPFTSLYPLRGEERVWHTAI